LNHAGERFDNPMTAARMMNTNTNLTMRDPRRDFM